MVGPGVRRHLRARPRPACRPPRRPPAPTPTQPSFRVEANFVRVDVYPTNAKGEPITDLTADDFEVLEDNKPQKVTQFERVALSTTTAREERRDPVSADDGRRQAADPRRRVFVIFLDTWHTDFAGAVRAPASRSSTCSSASSARESVRSDDPGHRPAADHVRAPNRDHRRHAHEAVRSGA